MSKNHPSQKITFLGLGVMGYPMAGHLAKSHYNVTVFNRTKTRADQWLNDYKGSISSTPEEACNNSDIVFCCVGADDDLREVIYGDNGAIAGMKKGAIFVDHTTASAEIARELSEAMSVYSINFLDAPVSGGQAGAEQGKLTVMIGGERKYYEIIKPVIECYSRNITHMGPAGYGQLTKMVNQICIAGVLQGLAEGLAFAQNAELDGEKVLDVISKGAAQSWQMENRGKTMLKSEFDFGFAVDWMRKDLNLCLKEANKNKSRLPITALVDQFYAQLQNRGGSRWDTSSLVQLLQQK